MLLGPLDVQGTLGKQKRGTVRTESHQDDEGTRSHVQEKPTVWLSNGKTKGHAAPDPGLSGRRGRTPALVAPRAETGPTSGHLEVGGQIQCP